MNEGTEGKKERILEEARQRRLREVVDVEAESEKLVVFSLSRSLFAFKGIYIKEILLPTEIYPVPGTPEYIAGLINVRGDIESVFLLDRLASLPAATPSKRNRILLGEHGRVRSGLMVESIEDVLDVPVNSIKPPLSTLEKGLAEYVGGEFDYRGKNTMLLDLEKLFSPLEEQK